WGRFLIREGFSANAFERSLGQRFLRKPCRLTKRFPADDIRMMWTSAGGTILAAISVELRFQSSPAERKRLGFSADGLPGRTAATVLRTFGLDRAEADAITRRPLPSIEPHLYETDAMIRRGGAV